MVFGQAVIGPPGSGKTTYCDGMRQFLQSTGRSCVIFNLDPANDALPYEPDVDIRELISLEAAAVECELGPNGALVYCLEYLEANLDWLLDKLSSVSNSYVLLDMPGQVELYTHHGSVRAVMHALAKQNHRFTAVHLVDAHHCSDPAKFISVLLVTLSTMVQLEMPQVNLLSKVDLIEAYGELAFNLDFYTDVLDPSRLLPFLQAHEGASPFARRHAKLTAAIVSSSTTSRSSRSARSISPTRRLSHALSSRLTRRTGIARRDGGRRRRCLHCGGQGQLEWDAERLGDVTERYMREDDLHELRPLQEPGSSAASSLANARNDSVIGFDGEVRHSRPPRLQSISCACVWPHCMHAHRVYAGCSAPGQPITVHTPHTAVH